MNKNKERKIGAVYILILILIVAIMLFGEIVLQMVANGRATSNSETYLLRQIVAVMNRNAESERNIRSILTASGVNENAVDILTKSLHNNNLTTVVESISMDDGYGIYICDLATGEIIAATSNDAIGKSLNDVGIALDKVLVAGDKSYFGRINGQLSYCKFVEYDNYAIGAVQTFSLANRDMPLVVTVVCIYLVLAAVAIVVVAINFSDQIKKEQQMRLEEEAKSIEDIKRQFSVIRSISSDYTDILLVDSMTGKAVMLKINGKLQEYQDAINGQWKDYAPTWDGYINTFVIQADRKSIRKKVELNKVLEMLETNQEYSVNYCVNYKNQLKNFQVKFIKDVDDNDGHEMVICAFRDVTDLLVVKNRINKLERFATRDQMTSLYNRRAYESELEELRGQKQLNKLVIACIDINGLKSVNDNMGHQAGDELIKGVAKCLDKGLGGYGRLFRTGGDEFMGILQVKKEAIAGIIEEAYWNVDNWHGATVDKASVAIGYVVAEEEPGIEVDELITIADRRMYEVKEKYYRDNNLERRK